MRCPKCGKIDFEYLERCPKCGHDLKEISRRLGGFIRPDPELNWFNLDLQPVESSGHADPGIDLDDSDISRLSSIAKDKRFQEALDQILRD